jgi:hypothetical protein
MKNIFRDIEENFQAKELITSLLLTGVFLFLSFVGYTRFTTIEIVGDINGVLYPVHVSYYGFPFEMVRMLTPVGPEETGWVQFSRMGSLMILWFGLTLNFVLFFLLSFAIVYFFEKLRISRNLA